MSSISEATPIILTAAERVELEGLTCSLKTEHRLSQRARIVLAAADGMARQAIGRVVGCATVTASKWRARYAEKRLAGLDETGNRGAERSTPPRRISISWRGWINHRPRAMPAGWAVGGRDASTLFASFEVTAGKVMAAHKKRRRRRSPVATNAIVVLLQSNQ